MLIIRHSAKEGGDEMDGIQVFYHGDGIDNKEIARVYLDVAPLCEESLEHLLVALRSRLAARRSG
jgi:hypothetical protein